MPKSKPPSPPPAEPHSPTQDFEALLDYLKQTRGFDFSAYKRSTLIRRIERRIQMINLPTTNGDSAKPSSPAKSPPPDFAAYLDYLEVHPEEFAELFNTVLINVTGFFRDLPAWESLAADILPKILAAKPKAEQIRIWSAGCSSGEEACTIAMLFAEILGIDQFRHRTKIYATDVDDDALATARAGLYSPKEVAHVPAALAKKYFEPHNGNLIFNRDLRRSIIFGRNDLIQDAPISRLDLILCRNTLMYMNAETQAHILERFHFALNDAGFLFMGRAEMLLLHSNLFTPSQLKRRIFTKVPAKKNLRERLLSIANNNAAEIPDLESNGRIREAAFEADPSAQILLDSANHIILINAGARALFNLKSSDLCRPLRDLGLDHRHIDLFAYVTQATAERRPLSLKDIEIVAAVKSKGSRFLDLLVLPLIDPAGAILGTKLAFSDVTRAHELQEKLDHSHHELETAFEELQTTNEELQSTVEELETTNEELQSSNEEMETMNEELQSSNSELHTMNNELARRTDEINHANGFLESILASLRSGIAVLDGDLNIQVWNAEELWGARAAELTGKNLLLADIGLPIPPLLPHIKTTLETNTDHRQIVVDAVNRRGKPIQCQVRFAPLALPCKAPHGVILLMDDVTPGAGRLGNDGAAYKNDGAAYKNDGTADGR